MTTRKVRQPWLTERRDRLYRTLNVMPLHRAVTRSTVPNAVRLMTHHDDRAFMAGVSVEREGKRGMWVRFYGPASVKIVRRTTKDEKR